MYCLKCKTQNEENARFCINCGENLYSPQKNNDIPSILLFVYILVALFSTIVNFVVQHFLGGFMLSPRKYVMVVIWLFSSVSMILPALAIRNTTLKIIGIIIALMLVIFHAIGHLEFLV